MKLHVSNEKISHAFDTCIFPLIRKGKDIPIQKYKISICFDSKRNTRALKKGKGIPAREFQFSCLFLSYSPRYLLYKVQISRIQPKGVNRSKSKTVNRMKNK
jgi:hypothetical protein